VGLRFAVRATLWTPGVLLAGAISLVRRDRQPVPHCGHAWKAHPGALIPIIHCADCINGEDHGDREVAEHAKVQSPSA
jgi:hypothetical protein